MTDAVNIKDAYVINIGVRFQVLTLSNYNKHEVVLACIEEIKRYIEQQNDIIVYYEKAVTDEPETQEGEVE